jgi:hypothetical protein
MIELDKIENAISEIIGTNYGECQCHRETMVQAVEALREKAEREKGCEYCNPNPYGHGEAIKQLITQNFNDKAHIHTFVRGNGLHTIAYPSPQDTNLAKTYSQCKIINYCPMCGKRLGVEYGE